MMVYLQELTYSTSADFLSRKTKLHIPGPFSSRDGEGEEIAPLEKSLNESF